MLVLLQLVFQWFSDELVYYVSQNSSIKKAVVWTDQLEQFVNGGGLQQLFMIFL